MRVVWVGLLCLLVSASACNKQDPEALVGGTLVEGNTSSHGNLYKDPFGFSMRVDHRASIKAETKQLKGKALSFDMRSVEVDNGDGSHFFVIVYDTPTSKQTLQAQMKAMVEKQCTKVSEGTCKLGALAGVSYEGVNADGLTMSVCVTTTAQQGLVLGGFWMGEERPETLARPMNTFIARAAEAPAKVKAAPAKPGSAGSAGTTN